MPPQFAVHFTYHSFSLLTVPSFIHEHATAILAANYCYNIVNEIHEITPFNQIRLNWSVSLNWINPLHYTSWFIHFVFHSFNWMKKRNWIHHSLRFIRVNFIDCLHSFNWMKLNQLKFIAHSLRTAFLHSPSFNFIELQAEWMSSRLAWPFGLHCLQPSCHHSLHIVSFIHFIKLNLI